MSILQSENLNYEHNGATFNAKGDLEPAQTFTAANFSFGGTALAGVEFRSNGRVARRIGTGGIYTEYDDWVTTGAGWIGGSNYRMTWAAPTGGVVTGTVTPSSAQTTPLLMTSNKIFEADESNSIASNVQWAVTIENIATGDTKVYTVNINVESST